MADILDDSKDVCVLCIETSTPLCSVAVAVGTQLIYASNYSNTPIPRHAESVGSMVDQAIQAAQEAGHSLDVIAVSAGPGSYTGLRIGASVAKGLSFGLQIPLIAIPTTEVLVATATHAQPDFLNRQGLRICPMIDARRMEVYSALYTSQGEPLTDITAIIVDVDTFTSILSEDPILFVGDGASKCRSILTHRNALFLPEINYPWAAAMPALTTARIAKAEYADVAYWEPHYLKEFVAVVGKNKVLNQLNQQI